VQSRNHLCAVHVGKAQVEQDDVGVLVRGQPQRCRTRGVHVDVMVARRKVDRHRACERRLVVHAQHPSHRPDSTRDGATGAAPDAGRLSTMVMPPPGVSSGSSLPPSAVANPRDGETPEQIGEVRGTQLHAPT